MNKKKQIKKFDLKKITRYGLGLGIFIALTIPPYIVYWKQNSMAKMGQGVKDDIDRIRSKGKTLYEIPRKYKQHDGSVRKNSDFYKDYMKQMKEGETED